MATAVLFQHRRGLKRARVHSLPLSAFYSLGAAKSRFDKPALQIMFQPEVTQIVRFLLERGLRFRKVPWGLRT